MKDHMQREQEPISPQLVVLVAGVIYTRIGKIGYALKSLGWRVVLLYNSISYINGHESCFDEMHYYSSVDEALSLASRYRPLVYHVFTVWEYNVTLCMLHKGIGPLVLDNYDTIGGMLKPEFMNSRYPGIFEMEKLCIAHADGLCCRNLELNHARRRLGYPAKGKTIYFPEYCWGRIPLAPADDRSLYGGRELHIVYAGNMNVEKRCRGDQYQMQFKNGFFLEFGKDLAAAGHHIHFYPGRNNYEDHEFEDLFSEYLETQEACRRFHIHRCLPEEELIKETASYDLGIEATWVESEIIGSEHSLPIRNRFGMSSKLFGYLDAGLGMVISPNFKMRCWMFKRYDIVLTTYLDFLKERLFTTPPEFYKGLRNRAAIARENNSVTKHAPRLAAFYFSVANSVNNKIIHCISTESIPASLKHDVWNQDRFDKILKAKEMGVEQLLAASSSFGTLSPATPVEFDGNLECAEETQNSNLLEVTNNYISEDNSPLIQAFNNFKPQIFMIESTLACNLHCPECAIGGKLITRKQQMLNFEQFKVLADKIRPYSQFLYPYIWGEPTLNPDIIPMLRYASSFTATNISTNGMTMTETLAEELITSGVSSIIVSIDGCSQDVYGAYRVGGDVNKAFTALVLLQLYNQKHGWRVQLVPQFVVFRHNQKEMKAFADYCHSLGLEPAFKSPYLRDNSVFEYSDYPEYIRAHYPNEAELKHAMQDCPDARHTFTILSDGSVVACCYDHDKLTVFGNLFEQRVEEIWNSPRYRQFRWDMLTGNAPRFCMENCLSYYMGSPERHRCNACDGHSVAKDS